MCPSCLEQHQVVGKGRAARVIAKGQGDACLAHLEQQQVTDEIAQHALDLELFVELRVDGPLVHLRLPRLLVLDFDCDVRVAQPVQVAALEVLGLLEQHGERARLLEPRIRIHGRRTACRRPGGCHGGGGRRGRRGGRLRGRGYRLRAVHGRVLRGRLPLGPRRRRRTRQRLSVGRHRRPPRHLVGFLPVRSLLGPLCSGRGPGSHRPCRRCCACLERVRPRGAAVAAAAVATRPGLVVVGEPVEAKVAGVRLGSAAAAEETCAQQEDGQAQDEAEHDGGELGGEAVAEEGELCVRVPVRDSIVGDGDPHCAGHGGAVVGVLDGRDGATDLARLDELAREEDLVVIHAGEARSPHVVVHARQVGRRHEVEALDVDHVSRGNLHQLRGARVLQLEPAVEAGARQRRCGRQPWRQVRLPVGEEVVCHPL
mmetsp:Transcript_4618/g.14557  ORF Transcript_4618/g.14557 Transcript_4618/m.14557 type:complete len:427 (+) Transcript_4618:188-1468(+)